MIYTRTCKTCKKPKPFTGGRMSASVKVGGKWECEDCCNPQAKRRVESLPEIQPLSGIWQGAPVVRRPTYACADGVSIRSIDGVLA